MEGNCGIEIVTGGLPWWCLKVERVMVTELGETSTWEKGMLWGESVTSPRRRKDKNMVTYMEE